MKIRLLTGLVGPGGVHDAGATIDMPKAEALRMIDRGYAELVRRRPIENTTPKAPVEKAVER